MSVSVGVGAGGTSTRATGVPVSCAKVGVVDEVTVATRHPPDVLWSENATHDEPLNQSSELAEPWSQTLIRQRAEARARGDVDVVVGAGAVRNRRRRRVGPIGRDGERAITRPRSGDATGRGRGGAARSRRRARDPVDPDGGEGSAGATDSVVLPVEDA